MQIHDLISCFDRVYIVNLPERLDRKQETIAEFERIGMDVPNERVRFIEATRPDEAGEFPSIGSLGNLISQTRVLRECMELGLDRVAICEDDIKFNTVSPEAMERIVEDIETKDWNMASLAYLEPSQRLSQPHGLVKWDSNTRGCHVYAVRGEAIKSFHDYLVACRQRPAGHPDGGAMFFDGAFNMARHKAPSIRFFIANPSVADQRASRTDLHPLSFFDRVEPFRSAVSIVRKVKNLIRSRGV